MFITYIQENSWCDFTFMNMSRGRHFVLGPLFIMASIFIEFWVHHVRHRVYAMHPDHYAGRSFTEIETLAHIQIGDSNSTHTRASKREVLLEECLTEQCSSFKLVFKHVSQPLRTGIDPQA